MDNLLTLTNITRQFGEIKVLNGANLSLAAGEAVAIIGPSGSGKSTLLHVAGLLDVPEVGSVLLQGKNVATLNDDQRALLRNKACGFVYQFHHLLREFTALENVLLPAQINQTQSHAALKTRAEALLAEVGLSHRLHHLPAQLSGGEQQRVAIARAIMNQPKILLADEPTGNLDPHTAEAVTEVLFNLITSKGMAALLVTHNPILAAKCHRVLNMSEGVLADVTAQFVKPLKAPKKQPTAPRKA